MTCTGWYGTQPTLLITTCRDRFAHREDGGSEDFLCHSGAGLGEYLDARAGRSVTVCR